MATKSHWGLVEHVMLSIFISKLSYSRMSRTVQIDGAVQQHLWAAWIDLMARCDPRAMLAHRCHSSYWLWRVLQLLWHASIDAACFTYSISTRVHKCHCLFWSVCFKSDCTVCTILCALELCGIVAVVVELFCCRVTST